VKTKEQVLQNAPIPGSVCGALAPCSIPGAITTSAFGSFYKNTITHDYNDVLPSANVKFDLGNSLVGRLAVARTMARPDYSALGGGISADDTTHTGNGGNPDLKPIRSTNFDATLEWYFAPRSLASAGFFYMDLKNYVGFGVHDIELFNIRDNNFQTYRISSPINSSGEVKGFELSGQMPVWGNFGVQGNYTYADAKEKNRPGCDVPSPPSFCGTPTNPSTSSLIGASKHTYNLSAYYEDKHFGARVAYTYRSHYLVGLDRSTLQYQDDTGTLAASFSYYLRDNITLQLDVNNLNNPVLKSYAANKDQPTAFYQNGRQFYFGVRIKI